jgi:hypothetical protein
MSFILNTVLDVLEAPSASFALTDIFTVLPPFGLIIYLPDPVFCNPGALAFISLSGTPGKDIDIGVV